MSEIALDCKGMPCPQPVLKCKDTIREASPQLITVKVDNDAAKDNVSRFLQNQNYSVQFSALKNEGYQIIARSSSDIDSLEQSQKQAGQIPADQPRETQEADDRQLVFITSDTIGHGDETLGMKLMHNFLSTLPEMGDSLWRIILINAGVKLAISKSPALESLQKLQNSGVSILVCGTCLDYFQLLDQKQIGETTNMLDVVSSLQLASKVIKV